MHAWADVATLVKTKALNGRFVAQAAANLPFVPEPGCTVAFVPPQTDTARRALVERVGEPEGGRYEIFFEGIMGDEAERLVGCHILVQRSEIQDDFFEDEPASWVHWHVSDEQGKHLGTVAGVIENPGQDLLEIERPDGSKALIPLVEDFLVDVDVARQCVVMKLPDGLLDL